MFRFVHAHLYNFIRDDVVIGTVSKRDGIWHWAIFGDDQHANRTGWEHTLGDALEACQQQGDDSHEADVKAGIEVDVDGPVVPHMFAIRVDVRAIREDSRAILDELRTLIVHLPSLIHKEPQA